jgi:Ca2+-binding RTX toxin-like protein
VFRGIMEMIFFWGGSGADQVRGGRHRDLLIGGLDADELFGEWGDDILIGSVTLHDEDPLALREIMTVWGNTSLSYLERVAVLVDSDSSGFLNSGETVLDDHIVDRLEGRSEQDWFFLPGGGHDSSMLKTLDVFEDFSPSNELVNSNVPHPTNPVMRQEHFALFDLVRYHDVTSIAIASGDWSDATVWSDAVVPPSESRVLIPDGVRVLVDQVRDEVLLTVRVDGILEFDPQVNTGLVVDTMIVSPSGALIMGTAAIPIAAGVSARIAIADRGPIDRDWDPFAFSRGIVNHGRGSIYGAMKSSWHALSEIPMAGAEMLTLDEAPINWQIGDSIVIAGSRQNESEERVIRNINGAVIAIDPLQYDHDVPKVGLEIHVGNLSRNVVIFSENTDLARRGHLMFMHTRNVDVNYAEFNGLGRSDKKVVVNDVEVDGDGVLVDGTGTNPRGRYSVHLHRNGVHRTAEPARVHGSVVVDSPGWGFVNHSSYVQFSDNVAYNVDGAAFVTEAGDEIGSFVGNLAIHSIGSGQGDEARNELDDFGHGGDGFWFQGGGVRVRTGTWVTV